MEGKYLAAALAPVRRNREDWQDWMRHRRSASLFTDTGTL